jgi:hypothetical protein
MIGWLLDLAEAEDYYADERLETGCWDDLGSGSGDGRKEKALRMAYNRLYYSKEFILPTYAEATADDLVVLIKAQCEMAYYLVCHLEDEDRRKGIQAQAVKEAGVVKEKYLETALYDTPIPQFVRDLLCQYLAGDEGTHFGAVDLARDEDESVNTKVHNF